MKDHNFSLSKGVRLKPVKSRIGRLILKDKKASRALLPEVGGRVYLRDGRLVFQELRSQDMKYYRWLDRFVKGDRRYLQGLIRGVQEDLAIERPTRRRHRIYRDMELLKQLRYFERGCRIGMKTFERNYRRMLSTCFTPPAADRGSVGTHIANFHMHSSGTCFTRPDYEFSRHNNKGEVLISYKLKRGGRRLHYATVHYFCGGGPVKLATFHSWKELFS
jgi:hypothetical protein